jgi:hypothetical protein
VTIEPTSSHKPKYQVKVKADEQSEDDQKDNQQYNAQNQR